MRILVVDDEPLISDLLGDHLEQQGHQTVVLTDGLAAAQAWAESHFDLLISDIRLPGCSGTDLLRKIRSEGGMQPCLLISGHVEAADVADRAELLPMLILAKPFSFKELDEALAVLIAT